VLNNLLSKNFYGYINGFRINEVKERLSDPDENDNILNIK